MIPVTIIIPLYNKESTIVRAINSIQSQSRTDWKLIVINDGSTDSGPDHVATIQDSRIQLVHQKNAGPGAARNAGIVLVHTPYVAFLDADDEWESCYLENALLAMKSHDVSLVVSAFTYWPQRENAFDEWAEYGIRPGLYSVTKDDDPVKTRMLLSTMAPWNCLAKIDVIRKYDGFYEKKCLLGEDQTLFIRIGMNEPFIIIEPSAVRYHTEDSELYRLDQPTPLPPYVKDPQVILPYIPIEKQPLAKQVLDIFALRTAQHRLRTHGKLDAIRLLLKFPGTLKYKSDYWHCLTCLIPGIRFWWKFKNSYLKRPTQKSKK